MGKPPPKKIRLEDAVKDPARVPAEEAPRVLCELAAVQTVIAAKLSESAPATLETSKAASPGNYLTVEEVATRYKVSPRWLRERADRIPGATRPTRKCLRFHEGKFKRWFDSRK